MTSRPPSGCLHCVASGRVQGVGFRAFVVAQARVLGLTGWVRNRPDGTSVEVWAEGPLEELERLRAMLVAGPASARVVQLCCDRCEATGDATDFGVRR